MIRLATAEDEKSVLQLLDRLGEDLNKNRGYSPTNLDAIKIGGPIFRDVVGRKDIMIFVYEENNAIIGLVTFYLIPSIRHGNYRGHIEDLVVDNSYRRKGIASQLMDAVKKYCKENNIKVIKLDSGNELKNAHSFYIKNDGKQTEKMFRFDIE